MNAVHTASVHRGVLARSFQPLIAHGDVKIALLSKAMAPAKVRVPFETAMLRRYLKGFEFVFNPATPQPPGGHPSDDP